MNDESVAVVTRSQCHDATWIGHAREATYDDTPAGPLRVVKRAVEGMINEAFLEESPPMYWKRANDDWILYLKEPT